MGRDQEQNKGGGNADKSFTKDLNSSANKAFKTADYLSMAMKGDTEGLEHKTALDVLQSKTLSSALTKKIEKVSSSGSLPPSVIEHFCKAGKGALGAIPLVSVAMKVASAKEIAEKVGAKFRNGENIAACVELGSKISQTVLGTAVGSLVSEGIGAAAAAINPGYAPEKSGGRETLESLSAGIEQAYETIRNRTAGTPVPRPTARPG